MPDNVRVNVDERAIRAISSSDDMRDFLLEEADPIVARAQATAPKRTGAGAASIRAQEVLDIDEWTVRVTWERQFYYMLFHDQGTDRGLPARQFLEAALEGVTE